MTQIKKVRRMGRGMIVGVDQALAPDAVEPHGLFDGQAFVGLAHWDISLVGLSLMGLALGANRMPHNGPEAVALSRHAGSCNEAVRHARRGSPP